MMKQKIKHLCKPNNGDGKLALAIIVLLIAVDQTIKILVKTNMTLGESVHITDWFQILFIENNGMAYGMTFFNKLVLSLFRLVAISVIGVYLWRVVHREHSRGYVACLAMVLAGASGNMFDSMFYGLCFDNSTPWSVAHLVPFGSGYASFLYGKVVDMFYFPLIVTHYPDWFPFKAGEEFVFFSPIFNFADSCICVSVALIFIFFRSELEKIGLVMKGTKGVTDDGNGEKNTDGKADAAADSKDGDNE